jgi:beta-glucosidase
MDAAHAAGRYVKARAQNLLGKMSAAEKADLMTGVDMWHFKGVERLGVPSMRVSDCGHGVTLTGDQAESGTCFPTAVGQASTWNRQIIQEMGEVLGREVRAFGCSMLLGPMVNIHRLPLGGRDYETYSEDPFLAGRMAAALVRGIQSQGVGACLKGFTANNQQAEQATTSAEVDERALREIYCPAFRIPVRENPPFAVMTSYNLVNGQHTSENAHLIRDMLKGDWGYDGVVLSDWRGVHSTAAIAAGLDLEMPGPGKYLTKENVLQALAEGTIDEAELNDRARRLLEMVLKCTADDAGAVAELDSPRHRELARRVAEEAMVLLKNDGGVLPFDSERVNSVAVIGPNAEQARLGGGGSASASPPYAVSVLDGVRGRCEPDVRVVYAEGCGLRGEHAVITEGCLQSDAGPGLQAEFFTNQHLDGEPAHSALHRQVDFSWGWAAPAPGILRNGYSVRWSGRLVPRRTGVHTLGVAALGGGFRLYVDQDLWFDEWGTPDGESRARTHVVRNRRAKLTAAEPVSVRLEYNKTANPAVIRLEWREPHVPDPVAAAAEAAAKADAAVVCVGLSNSYEGGNLDRESMDLPGQQDRLVEAIANANPNTVVVLTNGNPVNMTRWIDKVPAVLEAWYPGQEGGNAVARVLFGDVNPSGKLPDTIPRRLEDTPAWGNYPGDGTAVHYREGVFVGYRHYQSRGVEPLFPFGFGLSYTTFEYRNLRLSAETLREGGVLQVSVDVANTGTREGKEVVQLYVRDLEASVERPFRELKGFEKVEIRPGQTCTVSFTLSAEDLSFFDVEANRWRAEPGAFEVMVGGSSTHGLTARFQYEGCRPPAPASADTNGRSHHG